MRRSILHVLGGLLAVAALAVLPGAASAAPAAPASFDPSCYDVLRLGAQLVA